MALIAKNKLDIYDIPIAELLDQYLEQIALMREADMDVASEFLEMAARLVQIKAASLLPQHEQDEEDPRAELTGPAAGVRPVQEGGGPAGGPVLL